MQRFIFVTYSAVGFHYWSGATGTRAYLANKHRHLFHVRIECPVQHEDREIEYHDLIDFARTIFNGGDMGGMSCESMAENLALNLVIAHKRTFSVTISEDDECGSTVVLEPSQMIEQEIL